jgi:hypothetical protein
MDMTDLWTMEEGFWTEDARFYELHLDPHATMHFPEPIGILDRERTISAVRDGERWSEVTFEDQKLVDLSGGLCVLAYRAAARRAQDVAAFQTRVISLYRKGEQDWRLLYHQQTPITEA